ncbi:MAG: YitT family protein [Erysipelotrichaceae bacterium]|nr:YitT family protein [Erysipelotrichaceae bacterium]
MQINRKVIKDVLLSMCAALLAAINIRTFVNAGNLVPGGFSGISLILVRAAQKYFNVTLNYSLLYLLFNIPVTLLVFNTISRRFTLVSLVDVVMSSFFVAVIPDIAITDDLLLISVFGGILGGISSACVLAGDACGGGMDFISIYMSKKKQKSVWNQMFIFNAALLILSGILFGWEASLYSIIFQFVATQVIDMVDNRYKRSSFIIISDKAEQIAEEVYQKYHHSVTKFDAIGGYTDTERTVLYTVVGEYEVNQLLATILSIDPQAFINISSGQRTVGNFHEKPL